MKKQTLLFLLMLMPLMASAYDVEINGIYYNLIPKANAAEVTSGSVQYKGDVEIPSIISYKGVNYSVISIGTSAFWNCFQLSSVTIPNTVTSIGDNAFQDCTRLATVIVSNNMMSIGNKAFMNCYNLSSVTIPNSVFFIGDYAFYRCLSLISVTIPSGVTEIGFEIFYGCSNLTSVNIPNGVTSIGGSAFSNCSSLKTITIPNSVKTIKGEAFESCSSFTSITIPNSVTEIGYGAFQNNNKLETLIIGSGVKNIENYAFAKCKNLTEVTCHAQNVPNTAINAFDDSMVEYATLYVFSSVNDYRNMEPWSGFGNIVSSTPVYKLTYIIDGEEYNSYEYEEGQSITPESNPTKEGYYFSGWSEIPETMPAYDVTVTGSFFLTPQCAKPAITFLANGKIKVESATEGATCITNITASNAEPLTDGEISLNNPLTVYTVTAYATKEGYDDSEVATATFRYEKAEGDMNGDGQVNISDVVKLVNMILGQ